MHCVSLTTLAEEKKYKNNNGRLVSFCVRLLLSLTFICLACSLKEFFRCQIKSGIAFTVFLPGFRTLGSTGPIEKLKGSHDGENRSQFLDTVNWSES